MAHIKFKNAQFSLPLLSNFKPPIWHTAGYVFGWNYIKRNLQKLFEKHNTFFYLIHPADFLDQNDLDKKYSQALERMDKFNYQTKIENLENILQFIKSNGYEGTKLINIANLYYEK